MTKNEEDTQEPLDINKLNQFSGTDGYHKLTLGDTLCTDGVAYLARAGRCYWLIDAIASYQHDPKIKAIPFQLWTFTLHPSKGVAGLITMQEDTDAPILVSQKLEYTDFQLPEIKLYLIDGILLLPGEY